MEMSPYEESENLRSDRDLRSDVNGTQFSPKFRRNFQGSGKITMVTFIAMGGFPVLAMEMKITHTKVDGCQAIKMICR